MELSVWKWSINRTFSITLLDCRVVCIKKSILGILHPAVLWAYHLILCVCECVHSVSPSLPSHILLEFAVSNYALHIITVFAAATELVFLIRFFPQAQSEAEAKISWLLDIINYYNILQRFCIYSYCIDIQLYIYIIYIYCIHIVCSIKPVISHCSFVFRILPDAEAEHFTVAGLWKKAKGGEGFTKRHGSGGISQSFMMVYDWWYQMWTSVEIAMFLTAGVSATVFMVSRARGVRLGSVHDIPWLQNPWLRGKRAKTWKRKDPEWPLQI